MLVDDIGESETHYDNGRYASFVAEPTDHAWVALGDDVRDALTPPFPAVVRFDVEVPDAAFLTVSPALRTEQRVGRAQVEFVVSIEVDENRTEVFSESLRHTDTNQWHDVEIDLTRWARRRVTLELTTRAPDGRTDMLWADRVQAVWGDPVIVSRPGLALVAALDDVLVAGADVLSTQTEAAGLSRGELDGVYRFAVDLLIGGLLSLGIRDIYKRFGATTGRREAFGNLFPVFTMATLVMIVVVRSSLALSLGVLGALSIVRFRSAIKSPEELAYLLFCASVGISLGADQRLVAVTSVVLVSGVVVVRYLSRRPAETNLLLTVSGAASQFYGEGENASSVFDRVCSVVPKLSFQRVDHNGTNVELRAIVTVGSDDGAALIRRLREQLPELRFSCVDADDVL